MALVCATESSAERLRAATGISVCVLNDLVANEKSEIKVISTFLPKQLNEEETKKICAEAIKSVGASSMKDIGKVMGSLKSKHADTLDFSKVSTIIKELLN